MRAYDFQHITLIPIPTLCHPHSIQQPYPDFSARFETTSALINRIRSRHILCPVSPFPPVHHSPSAVSPALREEGTATLCFCPFLISISEGLDRLVSQCYYTFHQIGCECSPYADVSAPRRVLINRSIRFTSSAPVVHTTSLNINKTCTWCNFLLILFAIGLCILVGHGLHFLPL